MASPIGTFIKTFLSTLLSLAIVAGDLFTIDAHGLKTMVSAATVSALPVIINWLNPQYKNYGSGKVG
jgi:hypothetical protein